VSAIGRPASVGVRGGDREAPFLATVGLRIEPAAVGSGVEFRLEVELGSMPLAFFRAVEDTLRVPGLRHQAGR
jgi:ribosomal protection tetracycline resistance protein